MAVISLGGKQYLVKPGEVIKTFNLNKAEGDLVVTKDLLTQKDVELKVLGNKLSKKTKVLKYRKKKGYKRNIGSRDHLTILEVASDTKKSPATK
jgi:ribosomal protein L21